MKTPGVGDRPQDEPRVGGPTFDGKLFRGRRFAQVHMVPVSGEPGIRGTLPGEGGPEILVWFTDEMRRCISRGEKS